MQSPEEHSISQVIFLGEQDGNPERELKQELVKLFSSRLDVENAYLARVHYGEPQDWHVALCLVGQPTEEMVRRVANIFFRNVRDSHLDVLLFDDAQKSEIQKKLSNFSDCLL